MTTNPFEGESWLEDLTSEECHALLRSCNVGRVAVSRSDAAPLVVPVNFVLDGPAIIFRTSAGAKVNGLRSGPISFQVDAIDPFRHTGWSVLVEGIAYEATHWEVDHLELEAWAPGPKERWVRLIPNRVAGRRISKELLHFDAQGYV